MRAFSDNAGGGARGLRASPSTELLRVIYESYGINGLKNSIDLGGSSSLNLLVRDEDNRYVVRVYRPYVTERRLSDIQLARQKLNDNGVSTSDVLPTLDGKQWHMFDNRLLEVEKFVQNDGNMDSFERLMEGLPLLGRIHTILKELPFSADGRYPLFANHIEPQKALEMSLKGIQRTSGIIMSFFTMDGLYTSAISTLWESGHASTISL